MSGGDKPIDDLWQNSMQEFRHHVLMMLGWVTSLFLLPVTIENLINARYLIAAFDSFVILMLVLNSFSIYRLRKQFIPFWLCYSLLLLVVLMAIYILGGEVFYWTYPLLAITGFVSEKTLSRLLTLMSLIVLTPFAFLILSPEYASRYILTLCLICFFSDLLINHIIKIQSDLSVLAVRDPLTNALNRRQMHTYLSDAIEETRRGFGPASLVLLDLDNFKQVNDTHGHDMGDEVLINVVNTLHNRQRRLDHVFRIGGEEFLILLRNTELKHAITTAESLRQFIEENELLEGRAITVSLGVAEYNTSESVKEWLARADKNLYEAKRLGRNRVHPVAA